MKTKQIFAIMIFGLAGLIACTDKGGDPVPSTVPPGIPKIASEFFDYSSSHFTMTNQYDASGRLIKSITEVGIFTITYGNNSIETDFYDGQNNLTGRCYYSVNSEGLAVSATNITLTKNRKYPSFLKMGNLGSDTTFTTYEYNSDGYLVKSVDMSKNDTATTTYGIQDGNTVSMTYTSGLFTSSHSYTFFADKTNTIGTQNRGIGFLGKQDNKPLKSDSLVMESYTYTYTYNYEFDSQSRVTKQECPELGYSITFTYKN